MEMRVLSWLRFRRPESILLALALLGSVAALLLACYCGNRILGARSGFWAAWILVLHPVFWHSGVTSALRVQLAVVSLAVAACCWNAWRGDPRWVAWSAFALGIGAGIRPETGPLLFPLWAVCALRAPLTWRERGKALAVMAGTVLVWLLPAMLASGGPVQFHPRQPRLRFGPGLRQFRPLRRVRQPLAHLRHAIARLDLLRRHCLDPARRPRVARKGGWKLGWNRIAFLSLWLVPSLIFAIVVHVEDPGHTLAMVPVVSLVGGYLVNRALESSDWWVSRWQLVTLTLAAWAFIHIFDRHDDVYALQWLPVVFLAMGLAMKIAQVKNLNYQPRERMAALVLFPILYINYTCFHHHGWYFKGAATTGYQAAAGTNLGRHQQRLSP